MIMSASFEQDLKYASEGRSPLRRLCRIERAQTFSLQRFPDWLEVLYAVLFCQRLEEGHAQHFAFAFVNARREKLMNIVAEQMTVQEGAPAVCLHEVLDGYFFF